MENFHKLKLNSWKLEPLILKRDKKLSQFPPPLITTSTIKIHIKNLIKCAFFTAFISPFWFHKDVTIYKNVLYFAVSKWKFRQILWKQKKSVKIWWFSSATSCELIKLVVSSYGWSRMVRSSWSFDICFNAVAAAAWTESDMILLRWLLTVWLLGITKLYLGCRNSVRFVAMTGWCPIYLLL